MIICHNIQLQSQVYAYFHQFYSSLQELTFEGDGLSDKCRILHPKYAYLEALMLSGIIQDEL